MIDIKPSQRNTNRHRKDGMDLLEKSINKVGVIESISVASDGTIISGHARFEHFEKQGKKPIEIHLKDNEYPVIVTDIENNSKEYFEAQILANTTANKNFDLDIEMIEVIAEEFDIDIENSYMVGDRFTDLKPADELGIYPVLIKTGYGTDQLNSLVESNENIEEKFKRVMVVENLIDLLNKLYANNEN